MQQKQTKTVNRGVKVELVNARVEVFGKVNETGTGKKFLNIAFHVPEVADDASSTEVKIRSTLWEEKAEKMAKAPSGARYSVTGFFKVGKPWEKEGRKIVSNEFTVSTISVVQVKTPVVTEVDDGDEIPF